MPRTSSDFGVSQALQHKNIEISRTPLDLIPVGAKISYKKISATDSSACKENGGGYIPEDPNSYSNSAYS